MSVFAAVMTGKGTGAISTIQLLGDSSRTSGRGEDSADAVIKKIFKPAAGKPAAFKPGRILLGVISDAGQIIDQVIIGCEDNHSFTINCHGNPLIVEMIMRLLRKEGAELITTEQLLAKTLSAEKFGSTLTTEAKLAQLNAKTLEGAKIIANQIKYGLSKKAAQWLQNIKAISLDEITIDAQRIQNASQTAKLIIKGCTAVIAGPPNSGKSTLLNRLAGREKAIVTDIKGTTRDWVSAECSIGPLALNLIDTAGLDEKLAKSPKDTIGKAARLKSIEMLEQADLILLVLDNSRTADQLDEMLIEKIAGKLVLFTLSKAEGKVLTILNKCDLLAKFNTENLPEILGKPIKISAKFGTGIETLLKKIQDVLDVVGFDLKQPVCITNRQENILKQLITVKSKRQAASIITELLNGQV